MSIKPLKFFKIVFCLSLLNLFIGCGGGSQSMQTVPTNTNNPVSVAVDSSLPLPSTTPYYLPDAITPETAIAAMKIGINLGNTLDAPHEGDWALAAKESYLTNFKQAGFKHVRLPVTWAEHTALTAPYQVDAEFMDRVEQVVDWALSKDLYVILNAHHESWLKDGYQQQTNKDRIDAIWMQIAERFKQKSAKLMFEMLNEPHGMNLTDINQYNQRILSIIRNENPDRLVVFSGNGYTPIASLLSADIPDEQDQYLIGNFHSYDPWAFAGQCLRSWGSDEDKSDLRGIYQQAYDWSVINNIPVMVNEFGVAKYDFEHPENVCSQPARLAYVQEHVNLAIEFGFAATYWDDGGSFSTFDRSTETWGDEKNILVSKNN